MALSFFFDECVNEALALVLRAHGIDVVTTTDLRRKGMRDAEQLQYATQQGRVIYSTDRDFLRLAHQWLADGLSFPGIVYHLPGKLSFRDSVEALLLVNAFFEPAEMQNRIEFL